MGLVLSGWYLSRTGSQQDGIKRMHQGLEVFKITDAEHTTRYFSSLLAEAYGEVGQPERGLELLAEIEPADDHFGKLNCTVSKVN